MKSANQAIGPRRDDARTGYGSLYAFSTVAAGVLGGWHGLQLIGSATPWAWPYVLAGVALGALGADLITGLVHWACDTWGDAQTPWLGEGLVRGFREHHRDPQAIARHDWDVVNGQAAAPACVAFAVLALPPSQALLEDHAFAYAGLYGLVTFSGLANQVHQWAHMDRAPLPARALQRCGLILSPARHSLHHSGDHTTDYCIATGWLNRLLDAFGFWRGLEQVVTRVTGAAPRRDDSGTCYAGMAEE